MNDIKLIALDLDGTLLGADHHTIPQGNIRALRAAADQGVRVAIASGRSWSLIRETAQTLGCVSFGLTANGAFTLDAATGKTIASFPLASGQCVDIIRILRRWELSYELYIGPDNYVQADELDRAAQYALSDTFLEMFRRNMTLTPDMVAAAERAHPGKFDIFYVPPDRREEIAGEIAATGPLAFTGALGTNMELNAPGVHKGRALAALAGQLGLDPRQVMAFGDADNDLEMLDFAHWSFAMANGTAEAKAAARFSTGSNAQGGVGMAVEEYVLGR